MKQRAPDLRRTQRWVGGTLGIQTALLIYGCWLITHHEGSLYLLLLGWFHVLFNVVFAAMNTTTLQLIHRRLEEVQREKRQH